MSVFACQSLYWYCPVLGNFKKATKISNYIATSVENPKMFLE